MVYGALRFAFGTALSIFYRFGRLDENAVPAAGPVVLLGNHPNALIDPLVMLRLTSRPVRFLAKAPIFKMPVLGSLLRATRCLPVYRQQDDPAQMGKNDDTFRAAHESLARGEVLCLFPEGKSHSKSAIEPLKTGAARIALGAEMERGFALGVRFVPVGLAYRDKGVFRSEVGVVVGEPIAIGDLEHEYARDPVAATRALTGRLDAALREVTVNLDSWEDLPLVEAASRLYEAERRAAVERRPFAQGLARLRAIDPARLRRVRRRILALDRLLTTLRMPADAIDEVRPTRAWRFALIQSAKLIAGVVPAAIGWVAYVIPYQATRLLTARLAREQDMEATVKLFAGMVFMPTWTLLLGLLGFLLAGPLGLALGLCATPLLGLFTLGFMEDERAAYHDARAYLTMRERGSLRERLLERRAAVVHELEAIGREVGVLEAPVT